MLGGFVPEQRIVFLVIWLTVLTWWMESKAVHILKQALDH